MDKCILMNVVFTIKKKNMYTLKIFKVNTNVLSF